MSDFEANVTDGFTVELLQKLSGYRNSLLSTSQPDGLIKWRASLWCHDDVNKSDVQITVRALELKASCLSFLYLLNWKVSTFHMAKNIDNIIHLQKKNDEYLHFKPTLRHASHVCHKVNDHKWSGAGLEDYPPTYDQLFSGEGIHQGLWYGSKVIRHQFAIYEWKYQKVLWGVRSSTILAQWWLRISSCTFTAG